ncbi:MAG TPA: hypothetical protein DHU63_06270 [Candidatus Marinimicrobia bacterium]|nr:MAG: hypothetical protein COY19_08120 [Candidatus Marinimicrobia bacterium CG_4_10_14_0_2_um_filter_48_9]PJA55014.1 MAG: hypothetical protein CO167_00600 [Candidatus Marinimicrobia bacterium CG_4_9_14_3_um_filter_48_9]HCW76128.1 hypothetical protein [Candidatus Neomarinimicrobiota bacterium]
MMKKMSAYLVTFLLMASAAFAQGGGMFTKSIWLRYGEGIGWAIAASIGFSIGVAIAIKVFDWFSSDIEEWEEIKKGNMGVAIIFVAMIVMIGLLVYKVI